MTAKTISPLVRLGEVIGYLSSIARRLEREGLEDEARSIETTIADLGWQLDELESVEAEALSYSGS